ncbi:MAG: phage tail tape measure protein, partial [Trebonia sp.]
MAGSREGNVGLRLLIIGKDGMLAGLREVKAATAALNAEIRAGAGASKGAAAASDAQMAGLVRLQAQMDLYRANLAAVNAETAAMARVGKVAFFTMAAAGAAWGYESVKWAQQYQTALVQLRTQAGLTVHAMNAIGAAAKANAAGLGMGPTAYLQTAYWPASAGFSTRETIAIASAAGKLAAIGKSPVETTSRAMTGIMKSYNLPKSQVTRVAARLDAIIGSGAMHAATLNAALASGVAATAKTFGVSLTSLGGALAFMTDRGVPAAQAGTHLRMTLSLLGAPSKRAATYLKLAGMSTATITSSTNSLSQMLQEAGVTSTQLSKALRTEKGKGGIYNALHLLKQHLTAAGLTEQMQSALIARSFGGGRMGSTIMMMYNTVASLGAKTTKIDRTSSQKFFATKWKRTQGTFDFQLHKFEGTIETLGTTFGTKLLPPLTKALSMMTSFVDFMGKHKGVVIGLASAFTMILVPAIGVYLKRALLGADGAIMTVLRGYRRLLTGQSEEDAALRRTQRQLAMTTGETDALAAADARLG